MENYLVCFLDRNVEEFLWLSSEQSKEGFKLLQFTPKPTLPLEFLTVYNLQRDYVK